MEHRFLCTACGKCCYGLLPLTWTDAVAHAERFPLCLLWTPVPQGNKDFAMVAKLGATLTLPNRKNLAVQIIPTAYLPASFPCPALGADNLCTIHAQKPLRCRTMPFYPYRDERFQAELLTPRPGWTCDISAEAPVVYRDQQIVDRADFDLERQELLDQVPLVRRYAEYMMKYSPALLGSLVQAAAKPRAGHVVTSLSSFLTATRAPNARELARLQAPLLLEYAERTSVGPAGATRTMGSADPSLAEFHRNYRNWAQEMSYLAQKPA
jgi:Fe-S-cluster containining protein